MVKLPLGRGDGGLLIVVMGDTWTDGGWKDDNFRNSCDLEVDGSARNAFGKAATEKKALSSNLTEEARLNVAAKNSSP